jgi:hypothetical protein
MQREASAKQSVARADHNFLSCSPTLRPPFACLQTKQVVKDTAKTVKDTAKSVSTSTSTKKKDNTLVELLPFLVTAVGIGIVWLVREKPWDKKKPAAPKK